jgi:predicted ATPase
MVGLPKPLEQRILGLAKGNPLFVEQMLSMLIDDGLLREVAGRWVFSGTAEAVSMPGNISSLLGARLDRLGPSELAVVELASVIGLEFSSGAVSALAGEGDAGADLESALAALCRKQLIRRAESGAADDFGFSHILVRDTAYDRLLKRTGPGCTNASPPGSPARPGPGSPSTKRSSATTLSSRSATGPSSARSTTTGGSAPRRRST